MSRSQDDVIQVPEILHDVAAQRSYKKGRFYGKGGFANCYEIIDVKSQKSYAGKIISKKLMVKQNQKEKISQEISIHSSLQHTNVVGFNSFFEDNHNVYIVLELCKRRSMMELQKRRKTLTEPETRFFIKQILTGVQYLHSQKIIHRDLKLGNLFLNDEFHVKIGDFGLATKIEYSGERKQTLCGTPNYIAPEILNKQGHSFEVDVWSIGCIMYTLLVGKPPFETKSLKETYSRIKKCDYKITSELSVPAKLMITSMLQSDPSKRPTVSRLSAHRFMSSGYCPSNLPVSALTIAPRFDNVDMKSPMRGVLKEQYPGNRENDLNMRNSIAAGLVGTMTNFNGQEHLMDLKHQIAKMLNSKPTLYKVIRDEMTDPASQPTIWISKWVDYSDKYGFGYQLSDESVGVMFNDATRLIMFHNEINVQYVDKSGKESHMTVNSFPSELEKKMKLLSYFSRYMKEHLVMTGASVAKEIDHMSRLPCLHQWCRSTSGVLMQLNNGTVQVNFGDHTKLILCPIMAAVTYVDTDKSFNTFKMSTLEKRGCHEALFEKIRYTYDKICSLIEKNC